MCSGEEQENKRYIAVYLNVNVGEGMLRNNHYRSCWKKEEAKYKLHKIKGEQLKYVKNKKKDNEDECMQESQFLCAVLANIALFLCQKLVKEGEQAESQSGVNARIPTEINIMATLLSVRRTEIRLGPRKMKQLVKVLREMQVRGKEGAGSQI